MSLPSSGCAGTLSCYIIDEGQNRKVGALAACQTNIVVDPFAAKNRKVGAPPVVTSDTCYNRILTRLALVFPEWDVYSSHQISVLRFVQGSTIQKLHEYWLTEIAAHCGGASRARILESF